MLLVFQTFFSVPVISRIESIGGGWAGGGRGWAGGGREGGGWAGAGGKPKAGQSSAVPSACGTN